MRKCQYKNLAELLLNQVRERPAMYLGKNSITKLPGFIAGYMFRDALSNSSEDFYFGENGFINWYEKKYKVQRASFWHSYFLDEASNNKEKALEIYFERLEEYYKWYIQNFEV